MQNEQTLIDLGFIKNDEGYWQLKGKHQTFIAKVANYDYPPYINLSKEHPKIDNREKSTRKGLHFHSSIKQCCSEGSVERAILNYDVPEEFFTYSFGRCSIVPNNQ